MSSSTCIIIIGANGRMGKTIAGLVRQDAACHLAGAVDCPAALPALKELDCPVAEKLADLGDIGKGDVVIDFSAPAASMENAATAAEKGLPMVIGTTGFGEEQKKLLQEYSLKTPLFWTANMSIGVNVLMSILPLIAKALGPQYDMEIVEIHHKRKKDAPSGTALMLGEALASARGWKLEDCRNSCRNGIIGERPEEEIGIQALRGGEVVGIHTCYFMGPGETISITHEAQSRENFARGAIRAALWLKDQKPGKLYSMADVIASATTEK